MIEPDNLTKEILSQLASVGKAMNDTYSEDNMETGDGFYLALDNLNNLKEKLSGLTLDESTRQGLISLIDYLRKKIERRTEYVGS